MNIPDDVITAAEAEELWHFKPGTVRLACAEGRIEAKKMGRDWLTTMTAMRKKYLDLPPANLEVGALYEWIEIRNTQLHALRIERTYGGKDDR